MMEKECGKWALKIKRLWGRRRILPRGNEALLSCELRVRVFSPQNDLSATFCPVDKLPRADNSTRIRQQATSRGTPLVLCPASPPMCAPSPRDASPAPCFLAPGRGPPASIDRFLSVPRKNCVFCPEFTDTVHARSVHGGRLPPYLRQSQCDVLLGSKIWLS